MPTPTASLTTGPTRHAVFNYCGDDELAAISLFLTGFRLFTLQTRGGS